MTAQPAAAASDRTPPDVRRRNIGLLWAVIVSVVVLAALLPALVAYRYTAPEQRGEFVIHPWRGWSFLAAALLVPGDSRLKTSGEALRKAQWLYRGTAISSDEVQLLFVPKGRPYTFTHVIDGRRLTNQVVPSYRFIWEVFGRVGSSPDDMTVAMLDYKTGRLLYDVRNDLPGGGVSPAPSSSPAPSPSLSASPEP